MAENLLLKGQNKKSHKQAVDYYYIIGTHFQAGSPGSHAFMISGATMNIIEAAADKTSPCPAYAANIDRHYTLKDLQKGRVIGAASSHPGFYSVYYPGYLLPDETAALTNDCKKACQRYFPGQP